MDDGLLNKSNQKPQADNTASPPPPPPPPKEPSAPPKDSFTPPPPSSLDSMDSVEPVTSSTPSAEPPSQPASPPSEPPSEPPVEPPGEVPAEKPEMPRPDKMLKVKRGFQKNGKKIAGGLMVVALLVGGLFVGQRIVKERQVVEQEAAGKCDESYNATECAAVEPFCTGDRLYECKMIGGVCKKDDIGKCEGIDGDSDASPPPAGTCERCYWECRDWDNQARCKEYCDENDMRCAGDSDSDGGETDCNWCNTTYSAPQCAGRDIGSICDKGAGICVAEGLNCDGSNENVGFWTTRSGEPCECGTPGCCPKCKCERDEEEPPEEPSPSPTVKRCFDQCRTTSECRVGLECQGTVLNKKCVNPSCPSESDCICGLPSPSPRPSPSPSPSPSSVPSPPPSPTPEPLACLSLIGGEGATLGDTMTFECSGQNFSSETPTAFFRYSVNGGTFDTSGPVSGLSGRTLTKFSYDITIDQTGDWLVQCKVCTDTSGIDCTSWGLAN